MRALRLIAPGEIAIQDVPIPTIDADEVLVKVAGAGLCHSDLHVLHGPMARRRPLTLGHETAGWVAAIGGSVSGLAIDDAVLVYLVWACGVCRACVQGRDNVCMTAGGRLGLPPCPGLGPDGGMAEYFMVKARYLEPLGDLDPVRAAPLADAGLTPMHAINGARHRLAPGAVAVVIGIGGLGHMAVQLLKVMTSVAVVAVDTDEVKLEAARRLGADSVVLAGGHAAQEILDLTGGYGGDAVFDFVGNQDTVDLAAAVIAPDGALRLVGVAGGSFSYPSNGNTSAIPWGVDIRRSYAGTRQDQRMVIDLVRAGRIAVDAKLYALDDGIQAFEDLSKGRTVGRAILVP
jgi:propanol-preferring alcohol dehydrogenase